MLNKCNDRRPRHRQTTFLLEDEGFSLNPSLGHRKRKKSLVQYFLIFLRITNNFDFEGSLWARGDREHVHCQRAETSQPPEDER